MKSMKKFYEEYWSWRKETGYLYQDWVPKRLQVACSMIKVTENSLTVLDVGCGEGTLGKVLKEKFKQNIYTVGVDISAQAVELAKRYYDEVHCLDIEKNNLKSLLGERMFDYAVCLEMLEHIFDPPALLKKMQKFIKEKGSAIVSFPNFAFYQYRLEVIKGRFPEKQHIYSDVEHLHYFTVPSFIKLLAEAGLEPVEIDGEFAAPSFTRFFPQAIMKGIMKRYPNFFGVQLVIKAEKKRKVS